jgi:GDP-mannose transporter
MDQEKLLQHDPLDPEQDEILSPLLPSFSARFRVPFLSVAYCTVSISAVFLNKIILSRSGPYSEFKCVEFLMLLQSLLGVFFLVICRQIGILDFPFAIDWQRIKRIAFVNVLFVLMTSSNAYSVKHLSLPMVSLLKNCQVVVVCFLEYLFLHTKPTKLTFASLCVIVFGSLCGSVTDLEFNLAGYIWMAVAVLSSAIYYILIKLAFKENKVPEFTLVFYNNVLSIPLFFLWSKGNIVRTWRYTLGGPWRLWGLIVISGFSGVGVNIMTYLFLAASTPTSFSVLGVIKKITQTLLGYVTWSAPANAGNVLSVCVGVLGGITYSIAKQLEQL